MSSRNKYIGLNKLANHNLPKEKSTANFPQPIRSATSDATDRGEYNQTAITKDGVSVFTCTNRPQLIEQVFANYLQQAYGPRELIVVLNNNSMSLGDWQNRARPHPDIRIFQLDEKVSLGQCTNYAIQNCFYDFVAKFDDDDYYAPEYLTDMMAAFDYCEADIIGKSSRFIYFKSKSVLGFYRPYPEYSYVEYVVGATMVFKKGLWQAIRFPDITEGEDTLFQQESINRGGKIFATDRYNYVTVRDADISKHTFQLDDDTYISYCQRVIPVTNYLPLITR